MHLCLHAMKLQSHFRAKKILLNCIHLSGFAQPHPFRLILLKAADEEGMLSCIDFYRWQWVPLVNLNITCFYRKTCLISKQTAMNAYNLRLKK